MDADSPGWEGAAAGAGTCTVDAGAAAVAAAAGLLICIHSGDFRQLSYTFACPKDKNMMLLMQLAS